MNRPADVDRTLESWLAEGPSQLPDHAIDGIVRQLDMTHQRKHWWLLRKDTMTRSILSVGGVAAAFLIAVVGFAYFSALGPNVGGAPTPSPAASQSPAPITGSLPAEQIALVARHAAALNSRDAEGFVDVFAADGAFNSRGTFASSSSLFSHTLPMRDRSLIEPFLAINEVWGFDAEVVACDQLSQSDYDRRYGLHHESVDVFGHCAVKSRWATLSLEIGETWYYEFNGTDIRYWGQAVRDATPANRALPLGLEGLLEWESWLEATDPDAAARLLNPRVYPVTVPCGDQITFGDETHTTTAPPEAPCEWSADDVVERTTSNSYGKGENDWVIAGERFWPSALIPYDPALADEIRATIEEYLHR